MNATVIVMLLAAGVVLFVLSVFVRARTGGKYEIKAIDLSLFLIPLLFWLIGTGYIQKISIGGVEFETAQAFIGASKQPIKSQVTPTAALGIEDVIRTVERHRKGGVSRIPSLIENKTEALEFRLGHGGYWGPAIQKYFESLGAYSFLRYAIILSRDGTLFGVFEAQKLMAYFRREKKNAYSDFAKSLNAANEQWMKGLPGFISGENAVKSDANKRFVLEEMERLKMEVLPVVNSDNRFVGMVDRAQLTASLIIDVTKKLESIK